MKNVITLLFLTTTILYNCSQETQNIKIEDDVFTIVDQPAHPRMTMEEYYARIGELIEYPKEARKSGIEGKVFVEFIVDKDGKVTESKVLKGIGAGCDKVALNAVINAGSWNSGKHNGRTVKQKIVLPISFELGQTKKVK